MVAKRRLPKSPAARKAVSEKIRKLMREGVPQKAAIAQSLAMWRAGRLGPRGGYRRVRRAHGSPLQEAYIDMLRDVSLEELPRERQKVEDVSVDERPCVHLSEADVPAIGEVDAGETVLLIAEATVRGKTSIDENGEQRACLVLDAVGIRSLEEEEEE